MSRSYTEQVAESREALVPYPPFAGYERAAEQLGLADPWPDLSAKFDRQVAQQEKQQAAYRYEEQQRE